MAIMVGSARHDENGNITGGTAGDQKQTSNTNDTAGEVSMQTMYAHSKGWYILRPKTTAHANKIAERMTAACNNACIGYDQNQRNGIVTYGIDTKTHTECDCSSLVRVVVKEATGTDPGNFTTANERSVLLATGLFDDIGGYTSQAKSPVYNGDILVTKTKGHTVVVVSGSARSTSTSGSSGTSSASGSLTVDGQIGPKTVTALQKYLGTTQDGLISGQNSSYKKYWTALTSTACKWTGGSSQVVKALQKLTGATQDGILGQNTAKKTQTYLIGKGYSCGSSGVDGEFGTNSAKALQRFLNANA